MKNLIMLILLLNCVCLFGQGYHEKEKLLTSGSIKIDTIEVKISVYEFTIVTESYFEKSKTNLTTVYTKIGKLYSKIWTRENSAMPEDLWRTNEFDFENGNVLNGKERFCFSGRMHGIVGSNEKEYRKSFNKTFDSEFVAKYVVELFVRIKNYR